MADLLHDLLTTSSRRRPGQTAVVDGDRSITYRQLDRLSDRLAETLLNSGVRRGDRIAFCLPKSIESIASSVFLGSGHNHIFRHSGDTGIGDGRLVPDCTNRIFRAFTPDGLG